MNATYLQNLFPGSCVDILWTLWDRFLQGVRGLRAQDLGFVVWLRTQCFQVEDV